jgi:hypothetical protein
MTTKTTKPKKIRARYGLTKLPEGTITALLEASLKGLTDHATVFPKPPVDLKTYQAGITAYEAAIPQATVDKGKNAVALKNKLRDAAVKMYTENAHYVEANCNDDMQTFLLSGFQPASTTKAPPQPLNQPAIVSVAHGHVPGEMKVKFRSVPKAGSYELRYGAVPPGAETPATWTMQSLVSTKPVVLNGLTPGTNYTFQVRALGALGHTAWSDPITRMAV